MLQRIRTREAEDVRRSQVKYNGTTVRQYLIAPSAGITCRLGNSVEGYMGGRGCETISEKQIIKSRSMLDKINTKN